MRKTSTPQTQISSEHFLEQVIPHVVHIIWKRWMVLTSATGEASVDNTDNTKLYQWNLLLRLYSIVIA